MKQPLLKLIAKLRQLRVADAGVAAVEFALVLPIMLMLYIGSVEIAALISMDRKLQSVTGAVGDLVARSDTKITTAVLEDYFKAADGIMTPYSTTGMTQMITAVNVAANGNATVSWSRRYLNGVMSAGAYTTGSAFTLPDAMKAISKEKSVIIAESFYAYEPLYGFAFKQTVNLYRENFFLPRFGGAISLN